MNPLRILLSSGLAAEPVPTPEQLLHPRGERPRGEPGPELHQAHTTHQAHHTQGQIRHGQRGTTNCTIYSYLYEY